VAVPQAIFWPMLWARLSFVFSAFNFYFPAIALASGLSCPDATMLLFYIRGFNFKI